MVASDQKVIAIIPDMPRETPLVNEQGYMSDAWKLYFDQLTVNLQTNLKSEGFVVPPLTASNIVLLTGAQSNNNIVYDSTNNAFKGNIAGTWKTFTLT